MSASEIIRFGAFTLVPHRRELRLGGTAVALGGRAFDLLTALVARRGALVSKRELMAEVWAGTVVEENNLAAQVALLRKVLAADPSARGSLQTVPGRGYCFVADLEVTVEHAAGADTAAGAAGAGDPALSLVVLPFAALDSAAGQAEFADGLGHTVSTDLSRISGLVVIAPATGHALARRGLDAREVARDLDVRYVLGGAVRRQGPRVRVNVQLTDGRSGLQVWAERFDGDTDDLLALEDRITGQLANAIGREVFVAAAKGGPARRSDPRCSDLVLRGIAADSRPQSLAVLQEQQALFARAVALDPDHADAHARLARAILLQVTQGHAASQPDEATLALGIRAAERALALDPGNARVHYAMGLVHVLRGEFDRAVLANEAAIERDRNFALAHNNLGNSRVHLGQGREALEAVGTALRLDPLGPQLGAFWTTAGFARLLLGELATAVGCFERACAANPRLPRAQLGAAIARGLSGDAAAARQAADRLRALRPGFRLSGTMDDCLPTSPPPYRAFFDSVLREGALRAGVPV